jgi:hypothetical protein
MEFKYSIPHILQSSKVSYPLCASHHVQYSPQVLAFNEFNVDRHFIYITVHDDEHKKKLQSYYNMKDEDLEEITKDWSVDLLVPADPAEISDTESPEIAQDTPGPSTTKKTEEV